ncbi:MAG TPA: hypothetical protein VLY63_23680, partial [Anaerolineae bacterium]|nr:hypothetical protein [Anaerolineae bacterium]
FGQVSVSNCARVVLHRDSSARSLIRGAMAAQVVVLAIYCVWVLAINGTVAPTVLAEQSGTALAPLAAEIGPSVHVLGSIFVILAMGIGSLHSSLPLCNLVRERLPIKRWTAVLLPRRRGRLVLRNRPNGKSGEGAGLSLGLTYLGLGAPAPGESGRKPLFRLDTLLDGRSEHQEMAVSGRWEATALYSRLPLLRQQGASVVMEVLDAGGSYARVRISSPMRLAYEGDWVAAAVGIADVVGLPDLQRQIVTWMVREGMAGHETVSLAEAAASSGQPEAMVRMALDALARQGFVQVLAGDGQIRYAPGMAARRGRQLPEEIKQALWERDEGATRAGPQAGFGPWVREALLGKRGRFLVSVAPVVAVFLLAEWLLLTGRESFSEPLAFLGVIVISLLGGIYPVLMLVAGRRKGEAVPGLVLRALGSPLVVAAIYLLFLTSLILYGLVIWQNPVERAAALATGLLMVGATVWMVRRGAFVGRTVVELREDGRDGGRDVFNVTSCGKPATATVRLGYADGEQTIEGSRGDLGDVASLKQVQFDLAATRARELKVWAHRITLEGNSEGLPAELEVYSGGASQEFDLRLTGGQVVVPIDGGACRLTITLPKSAAV